MQGYRSGGYIDPLWPVLIPFVAVFPNAPSSPATPNHLTWQKLVWSFMPFDVTAFCLLCLLELKHYHYYSGASFTEYQLVLYFLAIFLWYGVLYLTVVSMLLNVHDSRHAPGWKLVSRRNKELFRPMEHAGTIVTIVEARCFGVLESIKKISISKKAVRDLCLST